MDAAPNPPKKDGRGFTPRSVRMNPCQWFVGQKQPQNAHNNRASLSRPSFFCSSPAPKVKIAVSTGSCHAICKKGILVDGLDEGVLRLNQPDSFSARSQPYRRRAWRPQTASGHQDMNDNSVAVIREDSTCRGEERHRGSISVIQALIFTADPSHRYYAVSFIRTREVV